MDGSPYDYAIRAFLVDHPDAETTEQGEITLVDPCYSPFEVTVTPTTISKGVAIGSSVEYTYPTITVNPSVCAQFVTFSCAVGANLYTGNNDLCVSFDEASNSGTSLVRFREDGYYLILPANRDLFPNGDYTVDITATVGIPGGPAN